MSRVDKSVVISSPPDKVIAYIADVSNHPAFISSLKSVANIRGDSKKAGTGWDWTYVMAGVEISGKAETVAYALGKQFSYKTTTGIKSTFNYRVEPAKGGSRLSVDVVYEIPTSLLGKVQAAVVEKLNDAEGARAVENLRAILDE
ncbi:MAG TPA: SRPBCC family protein [Gemmatimonadales bacterium]|nr:SRPBCC family protein [Gemmatimonadales bacterium]